MPLLVLVPGSGILLSLPVLIFLEEVESLGGPLPSALFLAHKSDFTYL